MSATLLYPYGAAEISGVIKTSAADFLVDEILGFEPSGEGEHLFLKIEKTGLSTHELIDQIALDFNIKPRDVGYSGLKDKHAITRQWLSLHLAGQMQSMKIPETSAYKILAQGWHARKLKPGSHRSNRFEVLIREVHTFDETTQQQIASIREKGMANYFGQQRFGVSDDNVSRALQIFANARKTRKLSRTRKGIYMSALRSELFNQILSARIGHEIWDKPVEGDVFMLSGSQSIFQEEITDQIIDRYSRFDISSTASLFGEGENRLKSQALEIEQGVIKDNAEISDCLLRLKAKLHRRPVRIQVKNFEVDYHPDNKLLSLKAELPRGSYFTSLLNHVVDIGTGRAH